MTHFNTMKTGRSLFHAALLFALICALCASPVAYADNDGAALSAAGASASDVERGRYLVTTSGCHDCHTPLKPGPNGPEPDMDRMLSGHPETLVMPEPPVLPAGPWGFVAAQTFTAHAGPWGVSYTANLTPDKETGLGEWTYENFRDTIRTGRRMGRGREILPPMPIPMYKHFNDDDLMAIYAFLRSIPAIRNKVPQPVAAEEN